MKKVFWLIFFFIFCFSLETRAQPFQLSFKHLTQDDGLSQGVNPYVYKDSRGFVWISSSSGLNRFDGKNVKTYKAIQEEPESLAGDIISSNFFEDRDGNLWFTTHEAIQKYDRAHDHFESFFLKDREGLDVREDYYAFHFDSLNGNLWLRTGLGDASLLHCWNTESQKDSLICPSAKLIGQRCGVLLDEEGNVEKVVSSMFPDASPGLEILDINTSEKTLFLSESNKPNASTTFTTNVYIENDSTFWIGTPYGLLLFNPKTQKDSLLFDYQGFIGEVWSIVSYRKDFLLLNSSQKGLLVFDKSSQQFIQYISHQPSQEMSLRNRSEQVRELYIDRDENLWVSIWPIGVDYVNLRKNKFEHLLQAQECDDHEVLIFSLHEASSGKIYAGSAGQDGLFVFDKSHQLINQYQPGIDPAKPLPAFRISAIFEIEKGNIWMAVNKHLILFEENKQRFLSIAEHPEGYNLRSIFQLSSGRILIPSNKGVLEIREGKASSSLNYCPELRDYPFYFHSIYEDRQGNIYLSKNGESLLVFEQSRDSWRVKNEISGIGFCNAFLENEEGLWMATSTGLWKGSREKPSELRQLTEKEDGIPAEYYYSILEDEQGLFWLSSNNGIIKYHPTQKIYHRYKKADGLQGIEFNTNAFLKDSNGQIWFGGLNGINVFEPQKVAPVPALPAIQFTKINYEGSILIKEEDFVENVSEWKKLVLLHQPNRLSLAFSALEYSDIRENQFQYLLEGYDEEWSLPSKEGMANYSNLPPGDYLFRIKASNSDGIWTSTSKNLEIEIRIPFWQTWWFIAICLLLLLAFLYNLLAQYRLKQALKIERMRVKISSDLHDDVGTLLSGLAMQTELMELTAAAKDKPKLKRIGEMSRNAMSRMRDTVWAIDARKDKVENLLDRMREHAEESLSPLDIQYDIELINMDLTKTLSTQIRQNVYLIFKEAITNVAKHSNASSVEVKLSNLGSQFEMQIQDNGDVKEKEYKTTGLGTSNMKMRAEQIGANLKICRKNGFCIILNNVQQ